MYGHPYPPTGGGIPPVPISRGMFYNGRSQVTRGVGIWCNSRTMPVRLTWVKPRVWVDGVELPPVKWGRIEVPLPAGRHRLQVSLPYLKDPGANMRSGRSWSIPAGSPR